MARGSEFQVCGLKLVVERNKARRGVRDEQPPVIFRERSQSKDSGILHGGALMSLADASGAYCAFLNLPDGSTGTATIESKTNFFRAVRDGHVDATSRPLHVGRTTIVVETDLHDAAGKLVRVIAENKVDALKQYKLGAPELLQVKTRDGFVMEAMMIKPPDFDARILHLPRAHQFARHDLPQHRRGQGRRPRCRNDADRGGQRPVAASERGEHAGGGGGEVDRRPTQRIRIVVLDRRPEQEERAEQAAGDSQR